LSGGTPPPSKNMNVTMGQKCHNVTCHNEAIVPAVDYSRDDRKQVGSDQRTGRVRITGAQKREAENECRKILTRIVAIEHAQRELSEVVPRGWWLRERP
jgi:hypothetical protein